MIPASIDYPELTQYWSEARLDNYATGTLEGDEAAMAAGYQYVRAEGYVCGSLFTCPDNTSQLVTYWHAGRGDNFTTATQAGKDSAIAAGYQFVRVEGYVWKTNVDGTVPLYLYYHAGRGDNFITATQAGRNDAIAAGYQFVRIEGYILWG